MNQPTAVFVAKTRSRRQAGREWLSQSARTHAQTDTQHENIIPLRINVILTEPTGAAACRYHYCRNLSYVNRTPVLGLFTSLGLQLHVHCHIWIYEITIIVMQLGQPQPETDVS